MKHSTKKPTKAEAARMAALKHMTCIACAEGYQRKLYGLVSWAPSEVHHLLSGNKRRGHMFTIPLCPYHHRGQSVLPYKRAAELMGPSLARSSKAFRATYGSDDELLSRVNALLGLRA
jgi:hypothetical protein